MVVLLAALVFGAVAALLKGQDPGGTLGLAATLMALSGFYLAFALSADLGDHGLAGDLYLTLSGYNSRYFLAGLVSGPALGAIGAWWNARGSAPASIGLGVLLLCEPLAIALISNVGSLARLAGGWAESDPRPYIGEFLLGLTVLAAGYLIGHRRPRAAATSTLTSR